MLEECWMKVYIICTCHPTCFIQHVSPFILSLDVKSKMATDMLLPVILSELVDSEDENPRRGKTQEWDKTETSIQFVIVKLLSYCSKETIEFDVKASFASRPLSGDITIR